MKDIAQKIKKKWEELYLFGPNLAISNSLTSVASFLYRRNHIVSEHFLNRQYNINHQVKYQATLKKVHRTVAKWLENDVDVNYDNEIPSIAWMMWFQGRDSAPAIVNLCIDSIEQNSGLNRVVVISENNISDFLDESDPVLIEYRNHKISAAFFSDYVRFFVLNKFGGVWFDATSMCVKKVPVELMQLNWWTPKGISQFEHNGLPSVQYPYTDEWVSYLCGSVPQSLFTAFMIDGIREYVERDIPLLDYFFVFYLAKIARTEVPEIHREFDEIPVNDVAVEKMLEFIQAGGKPLEFFLDPETFLYKLTYKHKYTQQQLNELVIISGGKNG